MGGLGAFLGFGLGKTGIAACSLLKLVRIPFGIKTYSFLLIIDCLDVKRSGFLSCIRLLLLKLL